MRKIKHFIRNWLIRFLDLEQREKQVATMIVDRVENGFKGMRFQINAQNDDIVKLKKTIDFAADVDISRHTNHSWAVVAVRGKKHFVRFIDLRTNDAEAMIKILRQFEKGQSQPNLYNELTHSFSLIFVVW